MARYNAANNWATTINMVGGLGGGVGDTTLVVADSTNHPVVPFKITIEDEICNVTNVSSNIFTIERGKEGTARVTHNDGALVENLFTAEVQNDLWDEVELRGVPEGGTENQVLVKISNDDYDVGWEDVASGGNIDGGKPDTNYGGILAIDGGGV